MKLFLICFMAVLLAGCSTVAGSVQVNEPANQPVPAQGVEPVVQEPESVEPEANTLPDREGATIVNFRKALEATEELKGYKLEDRDIDERDRETYPGLVAQAIFKDRNIVDHQDEFWLFEFATVEDAYALYKDDLQFWGESKNRSVTNGYLVLRVLNKESDNLDLYKNILTNLTP